MELQSITFPGLPEAYKVAPAAESADYPGCYYRTTNGVTEWVNPPMLLGVEYRTTERWNGKVVYAKLIDLGALPNNTEKNVTHGIANLENALSISAFAKSSDWQFTLPSSYAAETKIVFAPQAVTITTTVDRSAYNGYATLKYTKSV